MSDVIVACAGQHPAYSQHGDRSRIQVVEPECTPTDSKDVGKIVGHFSAVCREPWIVLWYCGIV